MPTPRCCFGAVTGASGRIYIIGGKDSSGHTLSNVSLFAGPEGGSLTRLASGQTDGNGALTNQLRITIPLGTPPGHYTIRASDDASHYPVQATITVVAGPPPPSHFV